MTDAARDTLIARTRRRMWLLAPPVAALLAAVLTVLAGHS